MVSYLLGQFNHMFTFLDMILNPHSHIIAARLPIDVGAFCDVLEFLFGSIIIASGWKDKRWHKVRLPWSWVARFMPKSMDKMAKLTEKSIDIPLLLQLITDLQQVLECISNFTSIRTGEFTGLKHRYLSSSLHRIFITQIKGPIAVDKLQDPRLIHHAHVSPCRFGRKFLYPNQLFWLLVAGLLLSVSISVSVN